MRGRSPEIRELWGQSRGLSKGASSLAVCSKKSTEGSRIVGRVRDILFLPPPLKTSCVVRKSHFPSPGLFSPSAKIRSCLNWSDKKEEIPEKQLCIIIWGLRGLKGAGATDLATPPCIYLPTPRRRSRKVCWSWQIY